MGGIFIDKIYKYKERLIECLYKNNIVVVQENVYMMSQDIISFRVKTKYFEKEITEDMKNVLNIPIEQLVRAQVFKITEELINYELTDMDKQLMYMEFKNGR